MPATTFELFIESYPGLLLDLQVAKLLITPCVCLLDVTLSKKRLILSEAVSILLVVAGVALV